MVTDENSALLFPIGHCIGAYYDLPESNDHFTQVRVGADVSRLDDGQFAIWGLAHGTPDRPLDQPWNREAVLAAAQGGGTGRAEEILESLIQDALLVETTPGTDSAVEFARQHRLVPLMLGLGNTAEEPWIYSVGMLGMPIVQLSAMAYDLYKWAHLDSSLWLACEGAAATAVRIGLDDPSLTDPVLMLNAFLGTLHFMLGPNAVYLDTEGLAN